MGLCKNEPTSSSFHFLAEGSNSRPSLLERTCLVSLSGRTLSSFVQPFSSIALVPGGRLFPFSLSASRHILLDHCKMVARDRLPERESSLMAYDSLARETGN